MGDPPRDSILSLRRVILAGSALRIGGDNVLLYRRLGQKDCCWDSGINIERNQVGASVLSNAAEGSLDHRRGLTETGDKAMYFFHTLSREVSP